MPLPHKNWWNEIPFVRLFICLSAGILLQCYLQAQMKHLIVAFAVLLFTNVSYFFLSVSAKFRFSYLSGLSISTLVLLAGCVLVRLNDIRNERTWIGHHYQQGDFLAV